MTKQQNREHQSPKTARGWGKKVIPLYAQCHQVYIHMEVVTPAGWHQQRWPPYVHSQPVTTQKKIKGRVPSHLLCPITPVAFVLWSALRSWNPSSCNRLSGVVSHSHVSVKQKAAERGKSSLQFVDFCCWESTDFRGVYLGVECVVTIAGGESEHPQVSLIFSISLPNLWFCWQ